jgi:drug/metabolite transporter (DMT)-like permease
MNAYIAPLLAVLIWSGNTVVSKMAAGAIGPAEISFYRWLLAALLFTPWVLGPAWRNRAALRAQLGRLACLGLLGMVAYQCLAYYAAYQTTATHMGIIGSLMPLVVLALSVAVLGHRLSYGGLLGSLLALAGVVLVVSSGHPSTLLHAGANPGDALMLVAMLAYAVYMILLKRWTTAQVPPLQSLYVQILVAVLALLPLYLLSPRTGLTAQNLPLVGFAGVGASMLAPLIWMHAVARIGPSRASMLFNLVPLCTALLAAGLLGESLAIYHAVGGALTVTGVLLAELWKTPLRAVRPAPC